MHRQNEVDSLLGSLFFFTGKEVQRIRNMYALASPKAIDKLIEILKEAQKKQATYIRTILKKDPTFATRTRKIMRIALASIKKDYSKKEPELLRKLEEQFED